MTEPTAVAETTKEATSIVEETPEPTEESAVVVVEETPVPTEEAAVVVAEETSEPAVEENFGTEPDSEEIPSGDGAATGE